MPPPQDAQKDLEILKQAIEFVNTLLTESSCPSFGLHFVNFSRFLPYAVRNNQDIYIHAGLFSEQVCKEYFPEFTRLHTWLSLFSTQLCARRMPAKVFSHIQLQLDRLKANPNHQFVKKVENGLAMLGLPSTVAPAKRMEEDTSDFDCEHGENSGTKTTRGRHSGQFSQQENEVRRQQGTKHGLSSSQFAEMKLHQIRERASKRTGSSSEWPREIGENRMGCSGSVPEEEHQVPPMILRHVPFPCYMEYNCQVPCRMEQSTSQTRRILEVISGVLGISEIVRLCYFPSTIRGYFCQRSGDIYINLHHAKNLGNASSVYILLCHGKFA